MKEESYFAIAIRNLNFRLMPDGAIKLQFYN